MAQYYLAWKANAAAELPAAPFEYIVQPTTISSGDHSAFFAALISAPTKTAAWDSVRNCFTNAELVYAEEADRDRVENFARAKLSGGVQIVPPKP